MGRLTPTPFHVYEGPDGTLVVRGELDMGTVDELQAKIDQVSLAGQAIVLDLAQLSFLDSAGVHCIIKRLLGDRASGGAEGRIAGDSALPRPCRIPRALHAGMDV